MSESQRASELPTPQWIAGWTAAGSGAGAIAAFLCTPLLVDGEAPRTVALAFAMVLVAALLAFTLVTREVGVARRALLRGVPGRRGVVRGAIRSLDLTPLSERERTVALGVARATAVQEPIRSVLGALFWAAFATEIVLTPRHGVTVWGTATPIVLGVCAVALAASGLLDAFWSRRFLRSQGEL